MKLFLLKRNISQYTFPDIFLGCFNSLENANIAREQYLSQYQHGRKIDPWKEQGYKTVDLEKDVEIIGNLPIFGVTDTSQFVFVVNSYSEGFGQIMRMFYAICGTEEFAKEKLREMKEKWEDMFDQYFLAEKFNLNDLYPDDNLQDNYWLDD
ncbi:MAG: hypothetical protein JNK81_10870 [Anaerolineales bacterium]|nr:hypothetical protein [Anaerolineales bacterium]